MEIVLLWLDELDDLVISGLSFWRSLRRICLLLALVAACGLHALPLFGIAAERLLGLHDAVLVALGCWTVFAAICSSAERSSVVRARRA
jgi:hypothetical protein